MQLRRTAVFALWADEAALKAFLARHPFGRKLNEGWPVRLKFVRRWGAVWELARLSDAAVQLDPEESVIAVTLARLRLPELPPFIH